MRLIAAAVAALLLVGSLGLPARAATPSPATAHAAKAKRQIALGVASIPSDGAAMDAFSASVGRMPALWTIWNDWGGSNPAFPSVTASQVVARGAVPIIWWQPTVTGDLNDTTFPNRKIIDGVFDAYIHQWARDAKAFGNLVIVRFAHEMEGDWFPWGVGRNGNTSQNFIQAWQHVWNIFKGPGGEGATNVRFLWSPYQPMDNVYPGASYVDYVGFTALNWASSKSQPWKTMDQVLRKRMKTARKYQKPILIPELGAPPDEKGKTKADWISTGYPNAFKKYPDIVGLVYFNVDTSPGQPDWRLSSPASGLAAYRAIVAKRKFQGTLATPVTGPTVSLTLPARTRPTVSLTLTATDRGGPGITGYYVSQNGTLPASPAWTSTKPTTFNLTGPNGPTTLYAWVRNGSGKISPRAAATTFIDTLAPTLTAGNQSPGSSTRERTLTFRIAAGEPLNCATVAGGDLVLVAATFDGASAVDNGCVVTIKSTIARSAAGVSSVAAAPGFNVADAAGNATTLIGGLPLAWTLQAGSGSDPGDGPQTELIAGRALSGKKAWTRVSWDGVSGATAYELQVKKGKTWKDVDLPTPSATHVDLLLAKNKRYTFRVRSRTGSTWSDWATGAARKLQLSEEDSALIKYTGEFKRVAVSGASSGFVREASVAGRSARAMLTGSSLAWVSTTGKQMGIAEVWLDGTKVATIDLYGAEARAVVVWAATVDAGKHVVEVRVTGTSNSHATSTKVDIDALVALS